MTQNTQQQFARYLSKDINLIIGDLQHLRWRYLKKEIDTLPLVKLSQIGRDKSHGSVGFVLSIEKNIHGDKVALEFNNQITVLPIRAINSISIEHIKEFENYFFALHKEQITKTATSLCIKQKIQTLENTLLAEGIKVKITCALSETYSPQEKWLFQQLLTDLCMALVEACQLSVLKETLSNSVKEIVIIVGEENEFRIDSNTLYANLNLKETLSTRSQRAEIINIIISLF